MTNCIQESDQTQRDIIIASNRGPATFQTSKNGELVIQRGSGGLVTALMSLAHHIEVTWVACALTEEDKTWQEGEISLSEDANPIYMKFISPDAVAFEGYYNVISNPLLWFLQHSMWDVSHVPVIDRNTWKAWEDGYLVVNRQFSEAISTRLGANPKSNLVMLQDYQLYMVASYLRRKLPSRRRPTILHFIHIPWPGPEYWGFLPPAMRLAILSSLCAVDVLGFQTRDDALNFIRTVESYLHGASVKYKRGRIWYRNHATHVRDFPISIDVGELKRVALDSDQEGFEREIRDIIADRKLILRIDRIEPSKNIVRGFQAFEELLELYPQHHNQVIFLALLVPSRMDVQEYKNYLDELMAAAGRVNARFGDSEWEPVRLIVGENYPRAVAALKMYDVLLVNAIADGMNLVAKEGPIVNQKDGVLILSERTGARQQLESGALVISPCDIYATAEAMHQALLMSEKEKQEKTARLKWLIEREDVVDWLCQQLNTIAELNL
jgi:trehalose 6-phosphate synthase